MPGSTAETFSVLGVQRPALGAVYADCSAEIRRAPSASVVALASTTDDHGAE